MPAVSQIALMVVIAIVFLWLWLHLLRWRVLRSQRQVAEAFHHHGALSPKSALPLEELGMARRKMIGVRDFQRMTLRAMISSGIVVTVEGDRFYFSEEALQAAIQARQKGK